LPTSLVSVCGVIEVFAFSDKDERIVECQKPVRTYPEIHRYRDDHAMIVLFSYQEDILAESGSVIHVDPSEHVLGISHDSSSTSE
jgi:hypothetical protein